MERLSYTVLKANIDCLFDKKSKPEKLVKAAQWVFGPGEGPFNMEGCCISLGARRDVLRLRVHFEFWRRWIVFPITFPFLIDPVPELVEGQVFMCAGKEGYALARAAWHQPGIRTAQLLATAAAQSEADADRLREALQVLSEQYVLSQQTDSWYLTGRNPILRAIDLSQSTYRLSRNHLSWSRMF